MNDLILCQEQKASRPYEFETIGKSIYTMEELCFYLWNYAHLLDVGQFQKEFSEWVREQLGQEVLATQLETLRRQNASLEDRVLAVFDSISYLSDQEREEYVKTLHDVIHDTILEAKKNDLYNSEVNTMVASHKDGIEYFDKVIKQLYKDLT